MENFTPISIIITVLINQYSCWVISDDDFKLLMANDMSTDFYDDINMEDISALKIDLIYPGTKWCGAGNTADNYDDLGTARETDMCCRDHDHCPDIILAGETKYNLTNEAFYTRLSCECDEKFRLCLRTDNSSKSKQVGTIYFNVLATKCFRKDYPVIECIEWGGWFNRKCLKYSYDTDKEQYFQWFDVNNF